MRVIRNYVPLIPEDVEWTIWVVTATLNTKNIILNIPFNNKPVILTTHHGVRFPASRLSVRKYAYIVATERILDDILS